MPEHDQAWSDYWRDGAAPGGQAVTGAAASAVLIAFWAQVFTDVFQAESPVRMLDVASGAGVVARQARDAATASQTQLDLVTLDYAYEAGRGLMQDSGLSLIGAVSADAAAMPFPDGVFDLVVSQFGAEYAGMAGLDDAARLVGHGGNLVLVCHVKGGAIDQECQAQLTALRLGLDNAFFEKAEYLFDAVHAGRALQDAEAQFVNCCERIVSGATAPAQQGLQGAQHMLRLVSDASRLCANARAYALEDGRGWLTAQESATRAYAERMQSMIAAAISADAIHRWADHWSMQGFHPLRLEAAALRSGGREAAWLLHMQRSL